MLAWNWSPEMSSASASSSSSKPAARSLDLAALSRSSALYGDFGTVPMRLSSILRAMPIAASHLTMRSTLPGTFGRLTSTAPVSTLSAHFSESSRKLAESKIASAIPRSNTSWGFSIRFCLSGFSMTTLRAFSMPIRFGRMVAPPQPGMRPRNTSGSANAAALRSMVR